MKRQAFKNIHGHAKYFKPRYSYFYHLTWSIYLQCELPKYEIFFMLAMFCSRFDVDRTIFLVESVMRPRMKTVIPHTGVLRISCMVKMLRTSKINNLQQQKKASRSHNTVISYSVQRYHLPPRNKTSAC